MKVYRLPSTFVTHHQTFSSSRKDKTHLSGTQHRLERCHLLYLGAVLSTVLRCYVKIMELFRNDGHNIMDSSCRNPFIVSKYYKLIPFTAARALHRATFDYSTLRYSLEKSDYLFNPSKTVGK